SCWTCRCQACSAKPLLWRSSRARPSRKGRAALAGSTFVEALVFGWLHASHAPLDAFAEVAAGLGATIAPAARRHSRHPLPFLLLAVRRFRGGDRRHDLACPRQGVFNVIDDVLRAEGLALGPAPQLEEDIGLHARKDQVG